MVRSREELLRRIERLGAEMRRRGIAESARRLRVYYLAVRHELTEPRFRLDVQWGPDLLTDWEQSLRIDPSLPVRPRNSACTCAVPKPFTVHVFPGGTKIRCAACQAMWLELLAP